MKFPDEISMGDKYGPALKIETQADADEYFAACVEHNMRLSGRSREEAERVERANLGYFAGYYDLEDRLRVERLFACAHPVFGKAANGEPTPEEAFEMGQKAGAALAGAEPE